MRHALNRGPTCSKMVSPRSETKYNVNEYTMNERMKMGRYGAQNSMGMRLVPQHKAEFKSKQPMERGGAVYYLQCGVKWATPNEAKYTLRGSWVL